METGTHSNNTPFYVGLCMAGAVSAGAYTAGVMDFLIEALDEWEQSRSKPGVPSHRVVIPLVGGASAGGMTAMVTVGSLLNPFPPVSRADPSNLLRERPENKLYHSWVDLTGEDVFRQMLDASDIGKGNIRSLLNSGFIEEIANRAMKIDSNARIDRPYFARHLKIFLTLSNLRGFWYDLFFRGTGEKPSSYFIHRHNDYARFVLNKTSYAGDGWIPLDFHSGTSVSIARDAAMATGAFPIGLQARKVLREARQVNDITWLREMLLKNPLPDGNYESLNVDGGMLNNEPFEHVRQELADLTGQHETAQFNNFNSFKSSILMIDPFPGIEPDYNPENNLKEVAYGTLSALINQARVKSDALLNALDDDCAGQFLIAPTRTVTQHDGTRIKETGDRAIGCGAFGGFSGFFHKEFRIHDYFLGRANCEKFLRDHFTVPEESTNLITSGYASLSPEQRARYYSAEAGTERRLPIIPVLRPRGKKYLPLFSSGTDWPAIAERSLDGFRGPLKRRVESLIMNLADYNAFTWVALAAGSRIILRRKIAGAVLGAIKSSLRKHNLILK